jgi:hypothetical protein
MLNLSATRISLAAGLMILVIMSIVTLVIGRGYDVLASLVIFTAGVFNTTQLARRLGEEQGIRQIATFILLLLSLWICWITIQYIAAHDPLPLPFLSGG